MKIHLLCLAAIAALSNPAAHADSPLPPSPAVTGSPASNFQAAQQTWQEVLSQLRELDNLIAVRHLAGVHDASLNLRDSARELRFGWSALPAGRQQEVDLSIRKIDGLLDDLHESADSNNPRLVARYQRSLHLLLDEISAAFPPGTLAPAGPVTSTAPARDPYCRMSVDPATAAATVDYAGQRYYFCSKAEATAFGRSPARYVQLYDELAFGTPRRYQLGLAAPSAISPGEPVLLAFAVREAGSSQATKHFQLVHEKLMHLILVSDDLSWFAHEHPALASDGRFYLKQTFPSAGKYHLYSDFTPADGTNQILSAQVTVGNGINTDPKPLRANANLRHTVGPYEVRLSLSTPFVAGRQTLLTYFLTKDGKPYNGMQPYLAAMGHMMAVSADGKQVVHTHAVSPGTDPRTGLTVTPAMSTSQGPRQSFKLTLPTSGLYRVWAQFNAGGQILTVPFTFNVLPRQSNRAAASTPRKLTINLPAGYKESTAHARAGESLALTFKLTQDAGCGNVVSVPSENWTRTLKPGQSATLTMKAPQSGPIKFQCGMGMFRGSVSTR